MKKIVVIGSLNMDVVIETPYMPTYTYGHTEMDIWEESGQDPNVQVAVEINLEKFKEWFHKALKNSFVQKE